MPLPPTWRPRARGWHGAKWLEGVPLQLDLHVAGHPGQLSRKRRTAASSSPQRVSGNALSYGRIGAVVAERPSPAASGGGTGTSPAPPTRTWSSRSGPETRPSLTWFLLWLLLEAGPLAEVVGALCQRGDEAQVAGMSVRECRSRDMATPPRRDPRRRRRAALHPSSHPAGVRTEASATPRSCVLSLSPPESSTFCSFASSPSDCLSSHWPPSPRVFDHHLLQAVSSEPALSHPLTLRSRGLAGPGPPPTAL